MFKNKQVRNRILYTLFIVLIFHIGTLITLPGVEIAVQRKNNFANILNLTSGGALQNFGFLALGVSPYITASILIQLLSRGLVPYYTELNEQGQLGRQKISQHTRYFSILFGLASAITILFNPDFSTLLGVTINATVNEKYLLAIVLAAGALFTTYLGEKIDEKGVGQGSSVLIGFGVLMNMPQQVITVYQAWPFYEAVGQLHYYWTGVASLSVAYIVVTLVSIWANKKEYKINIQSKSNEKIIKAHYMPIKLLASSVMPVIFSTSILSLIATIGTLFGYTIHIADYTNPIGFALYIVLILIFSYIYNTIQIDGREISKGLNEGGMYILGVSNLDTEKYITKKVLKITNLGAPILAFIAGIAIGVELLVPGDFGLSLTGINILILVGTIQELIHQIKGLTEKNSYGDIL